MKDRLGTSLVTNILFTTVILFCYLALSVIANYALVASDFKISNFPYDIAIGLPIIYSNYIPNGVIVQQNLSFINLGYNFVFTSLLILIGYCGYWLWIMPAETLRLRHSQLRLKCLVFNQIVITGIEFFLLTIAIWNEGHFDFPLYLNVVALYLINLVIYIKYDRLEQKAKEIKEEDYKDVTY